jgi:hypothetical protein
VTNRYSEGQCPYCSSEDWLELSMQYPNVTRTESGMLVRSHVNNPDHYEPMGVWWVRLQDGRIERRVLAQRAGGPALCPWWDYKADICRYEGVDLFISRELAEVAGPDETVRFRAAAQMQCDIDGVPTAAQTIDKFMRFQEIEGLKNA